MANDVQNVNTTALNNISALHTLPTYKYNESKNGAKDDLWSLKDEYLQFYSSQFNSLQPQFDKLITGSRAKLYFKKSGLTTQELAKIWNLSDGTRDGSLSIIEFIAAMHLIVVRKNGYEIPDKLPSNLHPLHIQKLMAKNGIIPKKILDNIQHSFICGKKEHVIPHTKIPTCDAREKTNPLPATVRRSKTLPLNSIYIKQIVHNYRQEEECGGENSTCTFKTGYKVVEKKQLHSCPDTYMAPLIGIKNLDEKDTQIISGKSRDSNNQVNCPQAAHQFNCFVPTTILLNDNDMGMEKAGYESRALLENSNDYSNRDANTSEEPNDSSLANFDFLPVLANKTNGNPIHHPVAIKSSLDDHIPLVLNASDDEDEDFPHSNSSPISSHDGNNKKLIPTIAGNTTKDPFTNNKDNEMGKGAVPLNESGLLEEKFESQCAVNPSIKPLPPPFPLPRSRHGRSASLDLNKLFAKSKDEVKPVNLLPPVIPPRLSSPNSQLKKKVEFCVNSSTTKSNAQVHDKSQNPNPDTNFLSSISDEAKLLIHQRTCSLDRKLPPSFAMLEELELKSATLHQNDEQSSNIKLYKSTSITSNPRTDTKESHIVVTNKNLEDITSRHKAHNYLLMRLNAKLNHEKWKLAKRKILLGEKLKIYEE